ncbi:uncharacterized protein V6R79_011363 [Siganus canaliculatus]
MKLMLGVLFYLVLCCATQELGVEVTSQTHPDTNGVIKALRNSTVALKCEAKGSTAATEDLVWKRNELTVDLGDKPKQGQSYICVSSVDIEDNGVTYTCHLSKNASASDSVTLDVEYGPQNLKSENVTVEEEAALYLTCDITANPTISNVSWTKDGADIDLEDRAFSVITDGRTSQLTTKRVERSMHEGIYKCSPQYNDEFLSKTFIVTVVDKTMKFPLWPMVTGVIVIVLTLALAVASRWRKIAKCFGWM